MICSIIDDIIDQLGVGKDVNEEDTRVDAPDEESELSLYEKLRNDRVAQMQAEFKRQFPDFEQEVLELKVRRKKRVGERNKSKLPLPKPRRSSRCLSEDSVEVLELLAEGGLVEENPVYHQVQVPDTGLPDNQPGTEGLEQLAEEGLVDENPVSHQVEVPETGVPDNQPGAESVDEQFGYAGDKDLDAIGKYGCVLCAMSFRDTGNMGRHVKLMHEPRRNPVNCPRTWCKAEFNILAEMIRHKENCLLVCPYPGCLKKFGKENKFSAHQRAHQVMARRMGD